MVDRSNSCNRGNVVLVKNEAVRAQVDAFVDTVEQKMLEHKESECI